MRRLEGAAAVLHDQSLAAAPAAPAPNTTTVSLAPGQVLVGAVKEGQRHFMGVPFAAPPLGDRRWTAPAPPAAWLGPREALTPGDTCVQSDNAAYTLGGGMSEDCLYLNVFAPLTDGVAAAASKPVLLFFYGGSWDSGSASCPLYYGGNLVATTDDVIVVTANYRVNAFGFLGGELLRDAGAQGSTGNWGLLDQRQAMRWVKDHAAAFGGDPNRVTIFGESAGAGSVASHLASPRSFAAADGPLFRAAAMESGNLATAWNSQNMSFAEYRLLRVAQNLGCVASDAPDEPLDPNVDAAVLTCMRAANSSEVYAAKRGPLSVDGGSLLTWSPVEDGVELLASPRDTLAAAAAAPAGGAGSAALAVGFNVSLLLGTNADEGSEFIDLKYDATPEEYDAYMHELMPPELADRIVAEYPAAMYNGSEDGKVPGHGAFWACARAVGDGLFTCPARRTARAFANSHAATAAARSGEEDGSEGEAASQWLYFFNHTLDLLDIAEPFDPDDVDPMGVFHGSELPFVFDFEVGLRGDGEPSLAKAMGAFWSGLAIAQDPNGGPAASGASAPWPAFTEAGDEAMVLATPVGTAVAPEAGLKSVKCDFWDLDENYIPTANVFGSYL